MNSRPPCKLAILILLLIATAGCSGAGQTDNAAASSAPVYAAVARGQVAIEGGLLSIVAPIDGTVEYINIHESDEVHAGELLAKLIDTPARANVATVRAQLQQAQAEEKLLALQQASARQLASRETAAAAAGAGAGQTADSATAKVAQLSAQLEAARATVAVARARLEIAKYTLAQHSLRAPIDAFVVKVNTQAGANVSASSGVLFELLPNQPYIIRAELNADYAQAIRKGMRASVFLESDQDGTSFPAHVLRVGRILSTSNLDESPATRATERTVECVLAFDKPSSLRMGRRVLVRFLRDETTQRQAAY